MMALLLVFGILPVASSYGAETTHSITLNVHGQVRDETGLPVCNNGGRIKLLSYKYTYYSRDGNSKISDNGLSRRAEVILHEMCSLKHRCTSSETKFPVADLNQFSTTVLEVSFQCLDQFETFIDICLDTTKRDDKPVHLIYKGTSAAYETCRCSIQGQYALSISDVRLKSSNSSSCSQAEIEVHNHKYMCDRTKDDYGSIFGRIIQEPLSVGRIVLKTDSTGVEPEMVYLTVKPRGSIKVVCDSKHRSSTDSVTASSYSASSATSCTCTKSKAISILLAVILCCLCSILGLCLGYIICYIYLKDTRPQWKKSSPGNDFVGKEETKNLISNRNQMKELPHPARGSSRVLDGRHMHLEIDLVLGKLLMGKGTSADKKGRKKKVRPRKMIKKALGMKKQQSKTPNNAIEMESNFMEGSEETSQHSCKTFLDVTSIFNDDFYKDKIVKVLPDQGCAKTEESLPDGESSRKKTVESREN